MTTVAPDSEEEVVTIVRPMNAHGTTTVEVDETNQTRHLVEYAEDELRATLSSLPEGTSLPVAMRRLNCRGNVWEAVSLGSRQSTRARATVSVD
ncbi:MAG: hypothetical protein ABEJ28_06610 [Salinigranum sp.]